MKTKFFHYAAIGLFVFGLSFLLVSHFQPPSVLGWQLQGFTATFQQLNKHSDGTESLQGVVTRYQSSNGAFRNDTSVSGADGRLTLSSIRLVVPGQGTKVFKRGAGLIEQNENALGPGPYATADIIEEYRRNPPHPGYRIAGTDTVLGWPAHVIEITGEESDNWFKVWVSLDLQGLPIKIEGNNFAMRPISISLGEPDPSTFEVSSIPQVLTMVD